MNLFKAAAAFLCAVCLGTANAQLTTITASSIQMGGKVIASGKVTFTPVDAAGLHLLHRAVSLHQGLADERHE